MFQDPCNLDDIYSDDSIENSLNSVEHCLSLSGEENLFEGVVVDLGGGTGKALHVLKSRYPDIKAICVDRNPIRRYEDVEYRKGYFEDTGLRMSLQI